MNIYIYFILMMLVSIDTLLLNDVPELYSKICRARAENISLKLVQSQRNDRIGVRILFKFLVLLVMLHFLFVWFINFSAQYYTWLDNVHHVKVPYFNFRQKACNNSVISFMSCIWFNGGGLNRQPLDGQGKRKQLISWCTNKLAFSSS